VITFLLLGATSVTYLGEMKFVLLRTL